MKRYGAGYGVTYGPMFAGWVLTRRSRARFSEVSLWHAEPNFDPTGGAWVAVCERHQTICNFQTKRAALYHMPAIDWCEACMSGDGLNEYERSEFERVYGDEK